MIEKGRRENDSKEAKPNRTDFYLVVSVRKRRRKGLAGGLHRHEADR